jgi:DNA ligase-1
MPGPQVSIKKYHSIVHIITMSGFRQFSNLITQLGMTGSTSARIRLLSDYFNTAPEADKVWTIALFTGRRGKRSVSATLLRTWAAALGNIPDWLFQESYHEVGDLAETIALLVPPAAGEASDKNLSDYMQLLKSLEKADDDTKKSSITACWQGLSPDECFVFNKLITGGFRIGVSAQILVQALAKHKGEDPAVLTHRISGDWDPFTITFDALVHGHGQSDNHSKPYPFYLAYALDISMDEMGGPQDWMAEWKWDGIRGQLIRRQGQSFIWSRGEELVTDKFPELVQMMESLPDGTVIDGEILALQDNRPMPFAVLQTRITRKKVSTRQLREAPVHVMAFDLLEWKGQDLRETPLQERRAILDNLIVDMAHPHLRSSPLVSFDSWEALAGIRAGAREQGSEGLMLKRADSTYQTGRKRGDWWKWKIDPMVIDAVMIYAQKGHGRRSNLYTDYTFAVRDGDKLVPFAKAYSGLTDEEFRQVDAFVKRNAIEKFGPVRTVKPELVFEIAFEGIAESKRHKSGIALRFPRMSRWRTDKKPDDINTLDDLRDMLRQYGQLATPAEEAPGQDEER